MSQSSRVRVVLVQFRKAVSMDNIICNIIVEYRSVFARDQRALDIAVAALKKKTSSDIVIYIPPGNARQ